MQCQRRCRSRWFKTTDIIHFRFKQAGGVKLFCVPETIHYKKIYKSVLNTITFYLEDDNKEEVNSEGEALTFILQMIEN